MQTFIFPPLSPPQGAGLSMNVHGHSFVFSGNFSHASEAPHESSASHIPSAPHAPDDAPSATHAPSANHASDDVPSTPHTDDASNVSEVPLLFPDFPPCSWAKRTVWFAFFFFIALPEPRMVSLFPPLSYSLIMTFVSLLTRLSTTSFVVLFAIPLL